MRLASANHKSDKILSKSDRERIWKAKKYYIQINLNTKNTNNKPYVSFSLNDDEDPNFKLTNTIKIIISMVQLIGIYEEVMLEKISKRNEILKGISDKWRSIAGKMMQL